MSTRPSKPWQRMAIPLAGCVVLVVGAVLGVRQWFQPAAPASPSANLTKTYHGLDLEDPAVTFETLRYTADTGGNDNTRAQAIVWLDQQTRTTRPLSPRQESWMLEMLRSGGHPQWDKGYKFWLFNSAFNTLHHCPRREDLTRLLKHLAVHDPEKTMRLYALQHLEVQRTAGRLTGPLAEEVRAIFMQISADSDGQEAGIAIRFLAEWEGAGSSVSPDVNAQALKLAVDPSRPVDVRVTALHASGVGALGLARDLAADATQPVLLRKASIALIGSHGGESDLTPLKQLASESTRLAQAADPATHAIRRRLSNPEAPVLISF